VGSACVTFRPNSDAGYAVLLRTLLGAPVNIGEAWAAVWPEEVAAAAEFIRIHRIL
jgi:hypothetical protein